MSNWIEYHDLGNTPYRKAWAIQEKYHDYLLQDQRAKHKGEQDIYYYNNALLMVEHPPVYTLGKHGTSNNLLADKERLAYIGAEFVQTDRGGDITYHGPGQIVGYPIFDLTRFGMSVKEYIYNLEEIIIQLCADYGVTAERKDKLTGVWVGENKICAIGVKTSRHITMHGFAFNIFTDLKYYDYIVPCGIKDKGVTNLSSEADASYVVEQENIKGQLLNYFARQFDASITYEVSISPFDLEFP